MKDRSLLDNLYDGYCQLQELKAIDNYKKTSKIYKNALLALHKPGVGNSSKSLMENLARATTFAEMIEVAKKMDPNEDTNILIAAPLLKTIVFFGGYVSAEANFAHYAFQLRDDIVKYAIDNNFSIEAKKEQSYTR